MTNNVLNSLDDIKNIIISLQAELKSKTDLESDVYYLDLIQFRDISNQIASKFDVAHQSPQLIIIKDGVVTYNASHSSINAEKIN